MAFLVLDAGTGSGKCVVFDRDGRALAACGERWSYEVRPNPDFPVVKECSFDPGAFWGVLARSVRAALAQSGVAPSEIEGVATTSQREGCVFLDARGKEIYAGPNIDARGFSEGLEVLDRLGAERLYRITGHSVPFIFPLARYLWFRRHGEAPVATLLMINDWITYRLCGELASEPSNATESMLFDLEARAWSAEILEMFDVPRAILPAVLPCGTRVGAVHAEAAKATGLAAGTPVYMGGADTQCALLGAGALRAGATAATLGTTTPVQTVGERATFDPDGNLWAGCHVVPDRWVLESNAGDTGNAFLWLLDLIAEGKSRAEQFRLADELASGSSATPAMLFVGPTVFNLSRMNLTRPAGLLFPFPSMHLRPDRGALVRGFVDNVAYAVRGNVEQLRSATGDAYATMSVSGGMTRSSMLVQTIADVLGAPIDVATEPESAALGCAMLIAAQGGSEGFEELSARMVRRRRVEPDATRHTEHEVRYSKWRELDDVLDRASI